MTDNNKSNIRVFYCQKCKVTMGILYLESVWEDNDEKTYKLIHFFCNKCGVDIV